MHVQQENQDAGFDRLVIVSNRLPVVANRTEDGRWVTEQGTGGLVTALAPILRDRGGLWIGWPGTSETGGEKIKGLLDKASKDTGHTLVPVSLSEAEVNGYYHGFSNECLWPLFHDLQSRCDFQPGYWRAYEAANEKYANVIAENSCNGDYIWVHDYHLISVAKHLRARNEKLRIGFFLHTPFPPLDIFMKLPWRLEILDAFLEYDLVGFQTPRDKNNFLHCLEAFRRRRSYDARRRITAVRTEKGEIRIGNFPISIDFNEFNRLARDGEVVKKSEELRRNVQGERLILGVDRLDYSKGIPHRLKAFEWALQTYPELRRRVTLLQVVVPSRQGIPEYQDLRAEIEGLVGAINGRLSDSDWVPVHYTTQVLERPELVAHYLAADMALVTPLKDGMNLVAKEYCAANVNNDGVLILSEFAGAARQFRRSAFLVNPYNIEEVGNSIVSYFSMSAMERMHRMRRLRANVRRHDVFWWMDSYLSAAVATDLAAFDSLSGFGLLDLKLNMGIADG
jgi:trehalose 6-phosphate synthase